MRSILQNEMMSYVNEVISIDNYQAKLGNDEDVSVIKLETNNKNVAEDLVQFIESGHKFVLDADHSPSKNTNGNYDIFVEIKRDDNLPNNIFKLIRDVENLTGIQPWKFSFYKDPTLHKMNEDNLKNIVPTNPDEYAFLTDDKLDEFISEFLSESQIKYQRDGKNLKMNKTFSNHVFEIQSINKKVKNVVFKIDESSSSQSSYLNSWIGTGYRIIKMDDCFKIAKGDKSIILKSKEL